ncbi:MAG TPA: hypothetical protein VM389_12090 [Phycisphaerae bacterium]|nr:hypothetical protein [Phycisphaerae bacterium]
MGKTEKIGGLAEDAAEALTGGAGRRKNWVARFLWNNAFPVLCGLMVTGAVKWVMDVSADHAETKRDFVNFQLETDYKFRRTEEALQTLAAENVALHKLLVHQQVELGVTAYKVGWLHPPSGGEGPDPGDPQPGAFDPAKLAAELEKRLSHRAKVSPEDLDRLLAAKRPLYEQRQMPDQAPAGGR